MQVGSCTVHCIKSSAWSFSQPARGHEIRECGERRTIFDGLFLNSLVFHSIRVGIVTIFRAYCVELCCFLICLCLVALSISLCQPALYQCESQMPFQPPPSVIPVVWLCHTSMEWYISFWFCRQQFYSLFFMSGSFMHFVFLGEILSVELTLVVHSAHVWWH